MLKILVFAAVAVYIPATASAACRNIYPDCNRYARYCYSPPNWNDFMKKNCQATCSRHCPTGTGGGGGGGGNGKCGRSPVAQGRIINGVDARPGAWPWMVSLNIRGRASHFCGGSLISPNWVLTASHCTDGQRASGIDVIIGEHDRQRNEGTEQRINVRRIIMHQGYNKRNLANDIALLELERPAQINARSQLVCLPSAGYRPAIGTKCYLSGWGTVTHPGSPARTLQQAMLPVVDKKNCFNSEGFVCTGFGQSSLTNACRGDSGGPLVCQESDGRWVQQGVASFVVTYCKYYTAFTRVGDHRAWIRQNSGV